MMNQTQTDLGICGHEVHRAIYPISSLNLDKNIKGSFFIGIGKSRTDRVYIAYTGNNINGYSLLERPISQSLLFEDENTSPYLEEVDIMVCNPYGYTILTQYKFHIPSGTIKMEYDV